MYPCKDCGVIADGDALMHQSHLGYIEFKLIRHIKFIMPSLVLAGRTLYEAPLEHLDQLHQSD
jgi:hypothetical protein